VRSITRWSRPAGPGNCPGESARSRPDAFADDEGVDDRLRAEVADALGEKYVEELDI
jgi:hypothetical protein